MSWSCPNGKKKRNTKVTRNDGSAARDRILVFGGARVPTILAELLSDLGQVAASDDADGDFLREE